VGGGARVGGGDVRGQMQSEDVRGGKRRRRFQGPRRASPHTRVVLGLLGERRAAPSAPCPRRIGVRVYIGSHLYSMHNLPQISFAPTMIPKLILET